MKVIKEHELIGKIEYHENYWTSKKVIIINNERLNKMNKTKYCGQNVIATIYGSFITGITLQVNSCYIEITEKTKIYEYILSFY